MTTSSTSAIYKTTDGASNWDYHLVDSGSIFQSIFFTAVDTGYVAGYHSGGMNGGIFETTDGGDHWTRAVRPVKRVVDIYFPNATTGYALTHPNPFNSSTEIRYSIPKSEKVMVTVHNILGQKIKTLISLKQPAGMPYLGRKR